MYEVLLGITTNKGDRLNGSRYAPISSIVVELGLVLKSDDFNLQGLLAVPFVLNSEPATILDDAEAKDLSNMAISAHQRYAEIFRDVERMISDHSKADYSQAVTY